MLGRTDPTQTQAWKQLADHFETVKDVHMKDLFAKDRDRFSAFSTQFEDILVDYSKNRITRETLELLLRLARETGVSEAIEAMFSGERINETEGRAVVLAANKWDLEEEKVEKLKELREAFERQAALPVADDEKMSFGQDVANFPRGLQE